MTSVLADRHPGELHLFRNYDPPALQRDPPYTSTATFQPLTVPQGKSLVCFLSWDVVTLIIFVPGNTLMLLLFMSMLPCSGFLSYPQSQMMRKASLSLFQDGRTKIFW